MFKLGAATAVWGLMATTVDVPPYVTGAGLVGLGYLLLAWYRAAPQRGKDVLEADGIRQSLEKQVMDHAREQFAGMREDVLRERENAARALAAAAAAQQQLAQTQVDLAAALTRASEERHALGNKIGELQAENAALTRKVEVLQAELETYKAELIQLRAQSGVADRRR